MFATFLLILLGFAFGGYAVARDPDRDPLQHAAAAALRRLRRSSRSSACSSPSAATATSTSVGIVFTALLAACTGMLGAVLALRRPA